MPVHVACPSCRTVLAVPDGAGGQQVNCPSCNALMTLPHVAPPPPAPPPSLPRSRRREEDEDDDRPRRRYDDEDDEDDDFEDDPQPARRKRIKTGPPSPQAWVTGGVSAVLHLVVGVAFLAVGAHQVWNKFQSDRRPGRVTRDAADTPATPTATPDVPRSGPYYPDLTRQVFMETVQAYPPGSQEEVFRKLGRPTYLKVVSPPDRIVCQWRLSERGDYGWAMFNNGKVVNRTWVLPNE